jgi:pyridoxine/pyridoxamine 5'-phosphate oxidase
MKQEQLVKAVKLAQRAGHVLVATADQQGMPHVTAAGKIALADEGSIAVTEWFCPGTVANLQKNKCVSVVVWTNKLKQGFQLSGRLEGVVDIGVLDGYAGKIEQKELLPQVEKRLVIKVEKILEFRLGPHSDVED